MPHFSTQSTMQKVNKRQTKLDYDKMERKRRKGVRFLVFKMHFNQIEGKGGADLRIFITQFNIVCYFKYFFSTLR